MDKRIWLLSGAAAAGLLLGAGTAKADGAPVAEVVVTATRLNQARDSIQPQVGASTYSFSSQNIQALPGGENLQLNQVILQAPGVAQDSFGQLHIRGDHNGLQYRLNGVILPEGLSVFGQSLNPRLAESVQLLTGALPAQYGLRTAGIVDIRTKSGVRSGGELNLYGGSHGTFQPSLEYGGASGGLSGYGSLSYLSSDRSLWRKAKEAVLSVKLEQTHDKNDILERYLNTVYFGRGAYGIQSAASECFCLACQL